MIESTKICIFCDNPLDKSDEHIIPQSINGRLHSTEIICANCNYYFGRKIDPIIKKVFNPLILILGWENANAMNFESTDGNEYVRDAKGKTRLLRPIKSETAWAKGTIINIKGDEKNAIKMFEKISKNLEKEGRIGLGHHIEFTTKETPYLRSKWEIAPSPELILFLNKVAAEFYGFNKLDIKIIKDLCYRIRNSDTSINNIVFCNFDNGIREFEDSEFSHVIYLKSEEGKLFCYLEFFNILCSICILDENYTGKEVDYQYCQDVITGDKIDKKIELKRGINDILQNNPKKLDFEYLINYSSERMKTRQALSLLDERLSELIKELESRKDKENLSDEEYSKIYLDRSGEIIARMAVYEFPYTIDLDENIPIEEDDDFNYFHSNFKVEKVNDFCSVHEHLIGKHVRASGHEYIIDSFYKLPIIVKKNKELITLYFKLIDIKDDEAQYIKVSDFISLIVQSLKKNDL